MMKIEQMRLVRPNGKGERLVNVPAGHSVEWETLNGEKGMRVTTKKDSCWMPMNNIEWARTIDAPESADNPPKGRRRKAGAAAGGTDSGAAMPTSVADRHAAAVAKADAERAANGKGGKVKRAKAASEDEDEPPKRTLRRSRSRRD